MSPFELDLGWKPKPTLEILASSKDDNIQSVTEFKRSLQEPFNDATFAYLLSQARKAAYNARKYTPHSYKIGDEAFLSKKGIYRYFFVCLNVSKALRPSCQPFQGDGADREERYSCCVAVTHKNPPLDPC